MDFALLLRVWLTTTLSLVAGLIVWELAPILIVMLVIAGAFGGMAAVMIGIARWVERRRLDGK